MRSHPSRTTTREVLTATAHLTWTTFLLIGAPLALARLFGWPLPTRIPDWGAVVDTPVQLIDPLVIRNVFVCLTWVGWLFVAGYVVVDIVDAVRGVGQRLHRIGPLGTIAGRLVGSAMFLITVARPATSFAAALPPAAIVQVIDHPDTELGSPAVDTATPPASEAPPSSDTASYLVQRGDSLWAIAETHLGSGFRWTEIYDLNRHLIDNPNLLCIGWQLTLPRHGDPALLAPPATFEIPGALPDDTTTPPLDDEVLPPPAVEGQAAVDVEALDASPDVAGEATITATPRTGSPEPTMGQVSDTETDGLPALTELVPGITGATVLATGLLLALRRRRRRTSGPLPPLRPGALERTLVAASDLPLVRWVGQELAMLGEQLTGRRLQANPVAIEFSEDTGIELLWDQPTLGAPAPWEAIPGGWAWRTLYDPDEPVTTAERPPLLAGLVTFGERDGRQLLVNLEALGSIAILGDHNACEDFIRALIVELASGDEIADAHVVTTPELAPADLADQLPRLSVIDPNAALDRLTASADEAARLLDSIDADSTFAYRIYNSPVLPLEVTVVASRFDSALTQALVERARPHRGVAALIIGDAPGTEATLTIGANGQASLEPLGITFSPVSLPAATAMAAARLIDDLPAPMGPDKETEAADGRDPACGWDLTPSGLAQAELDPASSPAAGSERVPDPAFGRESVDDELVVDDEVIDLTDPVSVTLRPLPEPRMLIKVLGQPRIVDGPSLGRRELALVVYVACSTNPVRHEHIQDAIWGGAAVSSKRVFNLISSARTALGRWDGRPILTNAIRPENIIGLQDGARTDLALLRETVNHIDAAPSADALAMLAQALELVEGPPFDAPGYEWAYTQQLVSESETLIQRAAVLATDLALDAGAIDRARGMVTQGLRGVPGDERLYRSRMRIEANAGNQAGVRRAYNELVAHLEEFESEPTQETASLYWDLLGRKARTER